MVDKPAFVDPAWENDRHSQLNDSHGDDHRRDSMTRCTVVGWSHVSVRQARTEQN